MKINRDIDFIAMESFTSACRRGKTSLKLTHEEICNGIESEFKEFRAATDEPSEHLPQFTQRQEELADIILAACTELLKECNENGFLPSEILNAKIEFNKTRK